MAYITIIIDLLDTPDIDRQVADALNTSWWVWRPIMGSQGLAVVDADPDIEELTARAQERWDSAPEWDDEGFDEEET